MEITTRRLLLREYVDEDAPAFEAHQSDPRAREFYEPADESSSQARALVLLFARWASEVPRQNWQLAVVEREAPSRLVGSVGLRRAGAPAGEAEFGLELAPAYWGQGYASEAARALLGWGFTSLGLALVRGNTVSANARVTHLVQRLGFRRVGEREGAPWLRARGWREVVWELRREDWHEGGS